MKIDWLINNTKASRGFISQRVQIVTYMAISQLFGTAFIKNHGRTNAGIPIGQILSPMDELNRVRHEGYLTMIAIVD